MATRAAAVLVALAAAQASGCGTASNVYKSMYPGSKLEPYGGVKVDVDQVRELGTPEWNALYQDKRDRDRVYDAFGILLRTAIDLPFTIIGDTLTLPFAFGPPTPGPALEGVHAIPQSVPDAAPVGPSPPPTPLP